MSKLGLYKTATIDYISILIKIDNISEIDLSFESVKVSYKTKYVEKRGKTKRSCMLVDSELFKFMMDELWYIREDVLKRLIAETVNKMQEEMSSKGWQFEETFFLFLDMDDFKEDKLSN